ncbi:MAG: AAA family ATPase [Deltaproteobacteria bacterium]|nr:AAA family ATPase [Deltaproteobacteria bacterium]
MARLIEGIADFPRLRGSSFIYAGKTKLLYNLIRQPKPYFLSRPGRFGQRP